MPPTYEGTSVPQGRIYRGTSLAPHIGRLDPTGYITRGIRQSRQRSGLAATALNVMKNRTPVVKPTVARKVATPIITHAAPAKTVAVPHPTNGTTSTLTTSDTGRISLAPEVTPPANNDPTSSANVLPYDDGTALARDSLAKSRDDALNNLTNLRNTLSQNITGQERNLDNSQPQLALNLLNRYAGRGMANSSGYGFGVGQQNQSLADQHAALEQQLQEGLAGYDNQQQQAQDAYQQGLSQLDFQAANSLASRAGQLGIGTPATPNSNISLADLATKLNTNNTSSSAAKTTVAKKTTVAPKPVARKPLPKTTVKKIATKLVTARKPVPKPAPKPVAKKTTAKKPVISTGGGGGTSRRYAL